MLNSSILAFVFQCTLVLGLVNGSQRSRTIVLLGGINGKKCLSFHQVFTSTTNSCIACVAACQSTTSCRSVFYGETTGKCYGCDRVYETDSGLQTETDTLYYMDTGAVFLFVIAFVQIFGTDKGCKQ